MSQKIMPCLWFDNRCEEAVNFYVSVFPNGKIKEVSRYGKGAPVPEGTMLTAVFEINGEEFMALNGGPQFTFTEAVSFFVRCKDQAEVDYFWGKLTADGGEESMCGWLKDKYGLSWQIIPDALPRLISDKDPARAGRAMQAMLQMRKIDVAAMERAARG